MSKSRESQGLRIGGFFLKRRGAVWNICWYDSVARQTRGVSTGESDLGAAELKLAAHALTKGKAEARDDVPLADALSYYWLERGQHLASFDMQRLAMKYSLDIWGNIMVGGLTPARQKVFVKTLRERRLADHTISRLLGCIWAALNLYHEEGRLKVVPARIGNAAWNPHLPTRKRVLTLLELGKLLDAAATVEHRWRYMVLAIGTGFRPGALLELRPAQADLEHGILHLNPEGRVQTKKRRPSIPMCPTLRGWVGAWIKEDLVAPLVAYNGEVMTSDTYFDRIAEEAGVDCCRYDIRHTVITWLVRRRVPSDEREVFIGHRLPGSATTEGYVHMDPEYLSRASAAIEELFQALSPLVKTRDLLRDGLLDEQPIPESSIGEVEGILRRMRMNA